MTAKETILKMTDNDNFIVFEHNNNINICIDDLAGFDDNWNEIFNNIDKNVIRNFKDYLTKNAISIDENFYTVYHFDGFDVTISYTSFL